MKLLRTMLITVLLAGGVGVLGACGGAAEPRSTAVPSPAATATVTAQPKVNPTKGEPQPATSTPLPAVNATPTAPSEPTPDVPPQTATSTPAGPPAATKPTPTRPPTIAPADTPVPADTPLPTATPSPSRSPTLTPKLLPTATPTPSPIPSPALEAKVSDTPEPSAVLQSDVINFTLENLTIPVGATVTWTNRDGARHTSTSGVSDNKDGIWDSPILDKGQKFSFTFNQPGVFPYWCRVHPFMTATVTVEG